MPERTQHSRCEYPALGSLVAGEWRGGRAGDAHVSVKNPATGEVLARLPLCGDGDVRDALDAAEAAFRLWSSTPPIERGSALREIAKALLLHQDRLAWIITLEEGKPLAEARNEIAGAASAFDWMAKACDLREDRAPSSRGTQVEQRVLRSPTGVVAAFSPWNYPAALAARKVATGLAAGCTVILKPAEETPGIWTAIGQLIEDLQVLPRGALSVLYGDPRRISEQLIRAPVVAHVSFTGSVAVGRQLSAFAGQHMKTATLELGGHSAVIVTGDVDHASVASQAVKARFVNAGQVCLSPSRFYVQRECFDAFVESFVAEMNALRVGNGSTDGTTMGPLANSRRCEAMQSLVSRAHDSGAHIAVAPLGADLHPGGNFFPPTAIVDPPPTIEAVREEIFGPIAVLAPFDTLDDAIELANSTDYGLATYAFTDSVAAMHRIQHAAQSGNVSINTFAISQPELPFGGWKDSGTGVEMGLEGLDGLTRIKSILRVNAR